MPTCSIQYMTIGGVDTATTATRDQWRREPTPLPASAGPRARAQRPASVRIEYGRIRCENSCTLINAPAVLNEMFDRHGITASHIDRRGIQHGRVDLTGARARAFLIVH